MQTVVVRLGDGAFEGSGWNPRMLRHSFEHQMSGFGFRVSGFGFRVSVLSLLEDRMPGQKSVARVTAREEWWGSVANLNTQHPIANLNPNP